jgi:hypothetical protein
MRLAALPIALAVLSVAAAASAQVPGSQAARVPDPLGRDTPRGTVSGFTCAVHCDAFVVAQAYRQLTPRQHPHAEALARNLAALLDRYYPNVLNADRPEVLAVRAAGPGRATLEGRDAGR